MNAAERKKVCDDIGAMSILAQLYDATGQHWKARRLRGRVEVLKRAIEDNRPCAKCAEGKCGNEGQT